MPDTQLAIRNLASSLEYYTSDRHWVDLETALEMTHRGTTELADDLIYLSNMEIKLLPLQLKRITNYVRDLTRNQDRDITALVDYYAESIDIFANFWYGITEYLFWKFDRYFFSALSLERRFKIFLNILH